MLVNYARDLMMKETEYTKDRGQMERFIKYATLLEEKLKRIGLNPDYCCIYELFPEEYEYQKDKLETITNKINYHIRYIGL